MSAIDDLLANLSPAARETPVRDVSIGLYWTAVCGRRLGLAATPSGTSCCRSGGLADAGTLHHQTLGALADRVHSSNPLEVSLGLAALNAGLDPVHAEGTAGNARDVLLARGKGKTVVTVGHFPFTDLLRQTAQRLWVLELSPEEGDVPSERAEELIPQADVIGLTASTLLNTTFDGPAALFPPGALVVMLGPSTPLHPVLFDYGIDILGGSTAEKPDSILRYVSQGSTLHGVPGLQRVTLAIETSDSRWTKNSSDSSKTSAFRNARRPARQPAPCM